AVLAPGPYGPCARGGVAGTALSDAGGAAHPCDIVRLELGRCPLVGRSGQGRDLACLHERVGPVWRLTVTQGGIRFDECDVLSRHAVVAGLNVDTLPYIAEEPVAYPRLAAPGIG